MTQQQHNRRTELAYRELRGEVLTTDERKELRALNVLSDEEEGSVPNLPEEVMAKVRMILELEIGSGALNDT